MPEFTEHSSDEALASLKSLLNQGGNCIQPLSILAVEDNPADLKLLRRFLKPERFEIISADKLSKALQLLKEYQFAAILLDLTLPDSRGIDTFYQMHLQAPQIPIVVLTGLDDEALGNKAVQAGAQDFLVKGQIPEGLLSRAVVYSIERHHTEAKMKELNDSLEKRVAQLAATNDELDKLTQALVLSSEQAIQASNYKSQFVARISHDLRAPISGILGITELLLHGTRQFTDKESRNLIELLDEAARSQLLLLNDILDLAKIESGKVELVNSDFCPVKMIEDIAQLFAASAVGKGVSLHTFVDPSLKPSLYGDPERLKEVLINLTNNAIKFTPTGEILISAQRIGESEHSLKVKFSVQDSGPGLAPEVQQRLFEPFTQADSSRQLGGTGLGLSICKRLVQIMGGEIGAESQDNGTYFWFTIPLQRSLSASPNEKLVLSELLASYIPDLNVLVFDESETRSRIVQNYIKSVGWKCDNTGGGAGQALSHLKTAAENNLGYSTAIINLEANEPAGLELAKAIRADQSINKLPLIYLVDINMGRQADLAWQCGFSAGLNKPVQFTELIDCIAETALGGRALIGSKTRAPGRYGHSDIPFVSSADSADEDQLRILVAEDNATTRIALVKQLEDLGALAEEVVNGQEAVAAIAQRSFDIIFMDCNMPLMSGTEATKMIRKFHGDDIFIVALTSEENEEACMKAGMNRYVRKPINREQLREIIEEVTKIRI